MGNKTQTKHSDLLIDLTSISPRRGLGEQKAAEIIKKYLNKAQIAFTTQDFKTTIPNVVKAELFANGKSIPCLGASFVSGSIDNNSVIVDADSPEVKSSQIIFNPKSDGVCLQKYINYPALAVNKDSVNQVTTANNVWGEVVVEPFEFNSQNILVGNTKNPSNVIFAHYDSIIGSGAVDNAGSVEVLYRILVNNSEILDKNLFVFVGSEEESISSHEGLYGFKIFDEQYHASLASASQIIVLDGVGIAEPNFISVNIDWVFSLSTDDDNVYSKVRWMQNDQTIVMKYYHTTLDTIDLLKEEYLDQAAKLLLSSL